MMSRIFLRNSMLAAVFTAGAVAQAQTPTTRPSQTPTPAATRSKPDAAPTTRPTRALERPSVALDLPLLLVLADPPQPDRAKPPVAPKVTIEPTASLSWLPLPNVLKLRGESPVRAHEPMLDPTGGESLGAALPVFRAAPTAALRITIPDPYEHIADIRLNVYPEDTDPPASIPTLPDRPMLTLEKPQAPATQPAKP